MTKKFFSWKILLGQIAIYLIFLFLIKQNFINSYWAGVVRLSFINIILVTSLNLATGFLGQLTLAHSAFMALGAYTSAIITKYMAWPRHVEFVLGMILGGLVAMIVAYLVSIPAMKVAGNYLVITTLAVNEIIRNLIIDLNIQGGESGCRGIPYYSNFTVVYIVAVISIAFFYLVLKSKYGRAIVCIPQNELLAKSCSINTFRYKLLVFSIAAFFAGIAGALYAHEITVIEPNMFDFSYSLELLAMAIIGGLGSINGSVLSAFLFTFLPYVFGFSEDVRIIVHIILMILVIIFVPNGLFMKNKVLSKEFIGTVKKGIEKKTQKQKG